jgi:hypothetical protein
MPDCVIDASVVALANGDIAGRRPGNIFDRRLAVIEETVSGLRRLRYNSKLLGEYTDHIRERRNDVLEALFALLDDTNRSVFVRRNTLSRQHYDSATDKCQWPSHDQHLLAAAIDGDNPSIVVTEERLQQCAGKILRHFGIHLEYIG